MTKYLHREKSLLLCGSGFSCGEILSVQTIKAFCIVGGGLSDNFRLDSVYVIFMKGAKSSQVYFVYTLSFSEPVFRY